MKTRLFSTTNSVSPVILRVLLALVVFPHGAQKLFGWYGGYGFTGTMNYFTETIGLPWILGFFIIMLETVGTVALIAGFATRFLAVCYTFLAIGIANVHVSNGFFMNWFGNQPGEGVEYFILWIGISIALFITGAGKFSVDREIAGTPVTV